jgi:MFS family permease
MVLRLVTAYSAGVRGVTRFGPLKERPFRLLWLGRTGSSVGNSMIGVALIWTVGHDLHGGASGLGVVLAANLVGGGAVTLAGGVWADRLPRRFVMIAADLTRLVTQSVTAVLLFTGTAHVWQLAILQGTAGAAAGFFNPASTALIPQAVSAERLQQANALVATSQSATGIFGPSLAGLLIAVAGAGWVFAVDAGSFFFSVIFVAAMRVAPHTRPAAQRFRTDLADGWREVRRHRWLTAGFLGYAVGNIGIGAFIVVGSLVVIDRLGGAWAWGLMLGATAVGGTLGGVVAYRFRPRHPVAAAFGMWTLAALPALALIRPLPLPAVMVAGLVFGGSILVGNTFWETAMQQEVRPDRLARVASIDALLSICLMPAGQVLAGTLQAGIGVRATLLLAAALMCVPNLAVVAFVRDVRAVGGSTAPTGSPAAAAPAE